jgi:hypothetical protein
VARADVPDTAGVLAPAGAQALQDAHAPSKYPTPEKHLFPSNSPQVQPNQHPTPGTPPSAGAALLLDFFVGSLVPLRLQSRKVIP